MRRVFSKPFPKNGAHLSGLLKRWKSKASNANYEKDLKIMDDLYAKLSKSNSNSLLKKHLKPEIYKALRTKRTKTSGLLDCIRSGLLNHDSGCGIYAPDAEAYQVFGNIFDPIIQDYHFGFKKTDKHPKKNFGNPCRYENLDPHTHYIASTRIRCARSINCFPFNPCLTKKQYDEIEDMVQCTLTGLCDEELKGSYHPLFGMKKSLQKKLIDQHYLFKEGDRFLQAANASRFWPTGRGIYHNFEKTFVVWVNEEDHIRIISMQRGGDFAQVFGRLVRAVNAIEAKIPFARDDRLGYLTFCPTNLGTTIRCSVHIRLPKLSANKKAFQAIADKFKLQVRGTRGEHSDAEGGIYDISNKRRLGLTECQAVKELHTGIGQMIREEKGEKGKAGCSKEPKQKGEEKKTAPKPSPKPASKPSPKAESKPSPKAPPKPSPKAAPKPSPKADPKPSPKKGK